MKRSQSPAHRLARRIGSAARRLRSSAGSHSRLGGRLETQPELVLGIIDDPELSMRLLSARGVVTASTVDWLARALREVPTGAILHLDLTDAEFTESAALATLGAVLDSLEDRLVRIRIVGLRPVMRRVD
jgi:anti-anti-sigma regulatory factor